MPGRGGGVKRGPDRRVAGERGFRSPTPRVCCRARPRQALTRRRHLECFWHCGISVHEHGCEPLWRRRRLHNECPGSLRGRHAGALRDDTPANPTAGRRAARGHAPTRPLAQPVRPAERVKTPGTAPPGATPRSHGATATTRRARKTRTPNTWLRLASSHAPQMILRSLRRGGSLLAESAPRP